MKGAEPNFSSPQGSNVTHLHKVQNVRGVIMNSLTLISQS